MRRSIRLTGILTALFLLLCGCAERSGPETAEPQKVSLSALQYEVDNIAVDFGNLWFYQQLEEKTGVHVDFTEVKDTVWNSWS